MGDATPVVTRNRRETSVDVVLAASGLATTLPLLVLIAATIAVESRGPIFARRSLQGRRGAPVAAITFRVESSRGLTRTGRFLRNTGLELLPALWNVIPGEVSLGEALRGD